MIWHALVDPAVSGRVCLTLLHSLWQAALFVLIAWSLDRLWRNRSVERRYAVYVAALVATLAAMPATYGLIEMPEQLAGAVGAAPGLAAADGSRPVSIKTSSETVEGGGPSMPSKPLQQTEIINEFPASSPDNPASVSPSTADLSPRWLTLAPWIVALYAAGVVFMLVRIALAIVRANTLAAHADVITNGPLVEVLGSLARGWSMRVVPALGRAERIVVPKVVGLARPMILLPTSAVSGLSPDELEMILAHELAHVRRYDVWVNLFQRLAETVLFFNPALWALSRRISTLREYCCDELACGVQSASNCEPRVRYATALLRVIELAEVPSVSIGDLASLAAGRTPSEIRRRVARLFGESVGEPLRLSRGALFGMIAVAIGLLLVPMFDQSDAVEAEPNEFRTLSFPEDGAAGGVVFTRPSKSSSFGHRDNWYDGWKLIGPARGQVNVPMDHHVRLDVSKEASTDLRFLKAIDPDAIQYLSLEGTDVSDSQLQYVGRLTGLQFLNLEQTQITDRGFRHLAELKNLRRLDLSAFDVHREGFGVGDGAMKIVARYPRLESISLRLTKVTDAGMADLAKCRSLRTVGIDGTSVTDEGLKALLELANLTSLRLGSYRDGADVTDKGMKTVGQMLQLKWLDLSGTQITDVGLSHLTGLKQLEFLSIDHTQVTNAGMRHLAALSSLKQLRATELADGHINDVGAEYLARVPSLNRIVGRKNVTEAGEAELDKLPKLESLTIGGDDSDATEEEIQRLKSMPRLKELRLSEAPPEVLAQLPKLKELRELYLSRRALDANVLVHLQGIDGLEILGINFGRREEYQDSSTADLTPLEAMPRLTHLRIYGGWFDLARMASIAKLKTLEHLNFGLEIVLDDDSMEQIAQLPLLNYVDINASVVTDKGLRALNGLNHLEILTIPCLATDDGLQSLSKLPSLRLLQIASPNITKKGLSALTKATPSLQRLNHFEYRAPDPALGQTRLEPPANHVGARVATIAEHPANQSPAFHLNVVGPDGKAVPNAHVELRMSPAPAAEQIRRGTFVRKSNYGARVQTDDEGQLIVTFPERPKRLNVNIQEPGYGPYWAGWDSTAHPEQIPREFTAELDAGWSVGSVVLDDEGKPVAGAIVDPSVYFKKRPGDTDQLGVGTRILTDAEGKWRFDYVPVSMSDVHVTVNHRKFRPLRISLPRDGFEIKEGTEPDGRLQLSRGLAVTGTVTDESGQPIEGALVRTKYSNEIRQARTNAEGEYQLVGCEPRMARIVVSAKGLATDMQEVRIDEEMPPVDFSMKPGGKIRVRVVDEQGKGIPKARIFFQRWRGPIDYFEFDHVNEYTDENGIWQWNEAPLDEFRADICRPGGMQLPSQRLIAREEEYVFSPPPPLIVSGSVVDAKTKKPIKKFRVTPGLRNPDPRIRMNWIPGDSYEATDGEYQIRFRHAYRAHLVRIEADGYQVAISRDIESDEGETDVDFELKPARDIAATIVTPKGEPAAHAKIALGVAGSQIVIDKGDIDDGSTYATRLDADAMGRFSIPARDEPYQIVITHPAGFAHVKSEGGPIRRRVELTAWARVEGIFRVADKPQPNVVLSMFAEGIHTYGDDVPKIFTHHDVTTGEDGRFVFERVFPGTGGIGRGIRLLVDQGATEVTSSLRVSAKFIAGETTTLNIGCTGRPVVGSLAAPADYRERALWNFAEIRVRADLRPPPRQPEPPADVRNDPAKSQAWREAWQASEAGQAWASAYATYEKLKWESPYIFASVDRDGSFRIDDVPAGNYVLDVSFSQHAAGSLSDYRFSIPPIKGGRSNKPLNLGVLRLK